MAGRRTSALTVAVLALVGISALQTTFVSAPAETRSSLRGFSQADAASVVAGSAAAVLPQAAHARLPDDYQVFAPIVDFLPLLPVFFFLLAFLWQAMVGFR
mmetsp:Transcript_57904/g.135368  ORF Transcript_57904/g.135368 Transcript_57904/m.135368 type:complete len:101 (+) Transcript_57904:78-380(+)